MSSFTGFFSRVLLVTVASASVCEGATTLAVADTFGDSNNPTINYGGAGALAVTAPLTKGTFSSVVRFDVSSLITGFNTQYGTGNWSLGNVQLALGSTAPNNAIFNSPNTAGQFAVNWISNDSWLEGTGNPANPKTDGIAWNDLATVTSGAESQGTFSYNPATVGLVNYTLTPTSDLTSDIMAGGLVSFYLTAADSTVSALFNSRTGTYQPTLTLTATPEPGRGLLLLAGLAGMIVRRRRS